jgi:hypothetical protein
MSVIRNLQVEERQPDMIAVSRTDFLAKLFQAPVATDIPNRPFESATKGYLVHFVSRDECWLPEITGRPGKLETDEVSLMMQALHAAFAEHIPFSLAPQMAWYLIAHEVAVHIGQNPDEYRGYFTSSDKKETINVRDDSLVYGSDGNQWGRSINLVREPMREMVPQPTIDLMLPHFSTSTPEDETAMLVLFLNMVANYYGLMWHTVCGIPAVRVEGDAADWWTVVDHAELAQQEFGELGPYFTDLLPVLREIAGTVDGNEPDPDFWHSIYKYGGGSGGPYINGWITAFFAHKMYPSGFALRDDLDWRGNASGSFSGLVSSDLPVHISRVPFVWNYYGNLINMAFVSGVMGVEHDGFLAPQLGFGVLEDTRKALPAG